MTRSLKSSNLKKKKISFKRKQFGGKEECLKTALFDNSRDLIKLNINSSDKDPWYYPNFNWPLNGKSDLMSQEYSSESQNGFAPIDNDLKIKPCFIPVPKAPPSDVPVRPMESSTLTQSEKPALFEGPPPQRIPPKIPGPPGPGAYIPGLAGIPVLPICERSAQPVEILNDLVNKGTNNMDLQPYMITSNINQNTCLANPEIRSANNQQSGGSIKKIIKRKNKSKKLQKKKNNININNLKT